MRAEARAPGGVPEYARMRRSGGERFRQGWMALNWFQALL
jgi:hypothetical protein